MTQESGDIPGAAVGTLFMGTSQCRAGDQLGAELDAQHCTAALESLGSGWALLHCVRALHCQMENNSYGFSSFPEPRGYASTHSEVA